MDQPNNQVVEEAAPEVEEEETVVWTPADAVNGTAGKQKGKTKRVRLQDPMIGTPVEEAANKANKNTKKK